MIKSILICFTLTCSLGAFASNSEFVKVVEEIKTTETKKLEEDKVTELPATKLPLQEYEVDKCGVGHPVIRQEKQSFAGVLTEKEKSVQIIASSAFEATKECNGDDHCIEAISLLAKELVGSGWKNWIK